MMTGPGVRCWTTPELTWSRDPVCASWQYSPFPLGTLENVIDSVVSTCIWLQMIDWDFNLRLFQLVTMVPRPAHLSVLALCQDNSIPTVVCAGHTSTRVQWHTSVTSVEIRDQPEMCRCCSETRYSAFHLILLCANRMKLISWICHHMLCTRVRSPGDTSWSWHWLWHGDTLVHMV